MFPNSLLLVLAYLRFSLPGHLYLFRKVSENYLFHCWFAWQKLDQIYRSLPLCKSK